MLVFPNNQQEIDRKCEDRHSETTSHFVTSLFVFEPNMYSVHIFDFQECIITALDLPVEQL